MAMFRRLLLPLAALALMAGTPAAAQDTSMGSHNPEDALRRVAPVVGTVYFETGDLR